MLPLTIDDVPTAPGTVLPESGNQGAMFIRQDNFDREFEGKISPEYRTFFNEFIEYFNKSQLVRTAMMNYFRTYLLEKDNIIEKDIRKTAEEMGAKDK